MAANAQMLELLINVHNPRRWKATPANQEAAPRFNRRWIPAGDARGQALVETALTLPLLFLLMFGIVQCGFLFNNWVMLTDAVRAGSRQLAISRTPGVDACQLAADMVRASAPGLNPANLSINWTVTQSCTQLWAGSEATLTATYPCGLTVMGINYAPGCTLRAQTTERVE